MSLESIPIIGQLRPDPIAVLLGTGYQQFTSPLGVNGLCELTGRRLEILAVHTNHPGNGCFRVFIEQAKRYYTPILIWRVTSDILDDYLPRYGFRKWEERQCLQGEWEHMEGYRWDE
jgi:hypothetical protein